MRLYKLGEPLMGKIGFCYDQKPCGVLVDAVDYPRSEDAVYAAELSLKPE